MSVSASPRHDLWETQAFIWKVADGCPRHGRAQKKFAVKSWYSWYAAWTTPSQAAAQLPHARPLCRATQACRARGMRAPYGEGA
eukprot:193146-Chlamydomonas_euryale.AAC.1